MKTLKTIIYFLTIIIIVISINSCYMLCVSGEGEIEKETFNLSDFSKLKLNVDADIELIQSDEFFVTIEAQRNIIENIILETKKNALKIKYDQCVSSHKNINIIISLPLVKCVDLNGSGTVKTMDRFNVEDLEININGSGEIYMDVKADEIESNINGSGDIYLKGTTDELDVEINGSGSVQAFAMKTDYSTVKINGSGDCKLNVFEKLNVKISGSGDVIYKGPVSNINTKISGSGEIKRLD